MKKFKKIMVWSMVALSVQFLGLLFIDKFFWKNETTFKLKKIDLNNKPKKIAKIKIPSDAKKTSVSFNSEFLTYYKGDKIIVVNNYTNEEQTISPASGYELNYYKWLPDRNRILIAEKNESNNGVTIKFFQYEPKRKSKTELIDNHGNPVKLKLTDRKVNIEDTAMSMYNSTFYFKLNQYEKTNMYVVDIMSQMERMKNLPSKIGRIAMMQNETKLIYDDLNSKKVKVSGKNTPLTIKSAARLTILGVDSDDKVFLGAIENDKVNKVHYGNLGKKNTGWKEYEIPTPLGKDDIFVLSNGKVYGNDPLKGCVIDLSTKKEFKYKGKLIEVVTKGIASVDDGVLNIVNFE